MIVVFVIKAYTPRPVEKIKIMVPQKTPHPPPPLVFFFSDPPSLLVSLPKKKKLLFALFEIFINVSHLAIFPFPFDSPPLAL